MDWKWSENGLLTKIKTNPVLEDSLGNKCLQLQTPLLNIYEYMKGKFPRRFDTWEYNEIIKRNKHLPDIKYNLNNELTEDERKKFMDCIFKNSIWYQWSEDDVIIIDNTRMAHARMNVIGKREIVTCMANFQFINNKSRLKSKL
jgi:hypothetical protein